MTKRTNKKSEATPEPASLANVAADLFKISPDLARPRPNIKFTGRRTLSKDKRKVLFDPSPVDRYSHCGRLVKLPPADWQKRNRLFYHESATEIANLFPHLYKLVKSK